MRRITGRNRRSQPIVAAALAADDPRAYGSPIWWHDPDVAASITQDGSNRVSSMLDLSGNGNDVTNAGASSTWPTLVAAELNGHAVLHFASQTLNKTLASPLLGTDWTVIAVVCRSTTATSGTIVRHGNVAANTGLDLTFPSGVRQVACKGVQLHNGGTMPAAADNTFEIWQAERVNGAAPTLKISGSADALSGTSTDYKTGANTLDYGTSVNAVRLAFCCAFNATGIDAAFVTALRTKYGI